VSQGGAVLPERGVEEGSLTVIDPVGTPDPPREPGAAATGVPGGGAGLIAAAFLVVVMIQVLVPGLLGAPWLQTWMTIFLSVLTQAMPFLVFGVLLSAAIAVFVPTAFFARGLPGHPALAVPVAGVAGVVLPGRECASGLIRLWDEALTVRRRLSPGSPVAVLDRLLRERQEG
jgi:hypothetical protein